MTTAEKAFAIASRACPDDLDKQLVLFNEIVALVMEVAAEFRRIQERAVEAVK